MVLESLVKFDEDMDPTPYVSTMFDEDVYDRVDKQMFDENFMNDATLKREVAKLKKNFDDTLTIDNV